MPKHYPETQLEHEEDEEEHYDKVDEFQFGNAHDLKKHTYFGVEHFEVTQKLYEYKEDQCALNLTVISQKKANMVCFVVLTHV